MDIEASLKGFLIQVRELRHHSAIVLKMAESEGYDEATRRQIELLYGDLAMASLHTEYALNAAQESSRKA